MYLMISRPLAVVMRPVVEDRPVGDDRPFNTKAFRPFPDRPLPDRPLPDRPLPDRPFPDRPFPDRPFNTKPLPDRPFSDSRGAISVASPPQPSAVHPARPAMAPSESTSAGPPLMVLFPVSYVVLVDIADI